MNTREHAASLCTFVRSVSGMILKDWPEDKHAFQLSQYDNHPLWVMGHLASTDAWLGGVMGADIKVPDSFSKLFGMGSKPAGNAKDYPSFASVRATFDETHTKLLAWLAAASEADLGMQLKDKTGGFTTDPVDAVLKGAWHEGWHFGQVSTLRRALGLPPVIG